MGETSEDRIAAALRTINFEVAAIKAAATERVEKAEEEVRRLREQVAELESMRAAADETMTAMIVPPLDGDAP